MDYADPSTNGNLAFTSGMLQSWNKFCYRGGYIEFNTSFPGNRQSSGFWAAGWISEASQCTDFANLTEFVVPDSG